MKALKFLFAVITLYSFAHPSAPSNYFVGKKILVIGASSGIGRASVIEMSKRGGENTVFTVSARRVPLLKTLDEQVKQKCHILELDVTDPLIAERIAQAVQEMGGLDIALVSITALPYEHEQDSLASVKNFLNVDVVGFTAACEVILSYFEKQSHGHLAAVTSISRERGSAGGALYCGAKAYAAKYLEGKRSNYEPKKFPIYITELIPGWVETEHYKPKGEPGTYWVIDSPTAAFHIANAIENKLKDGYIEPRQKYIAKLLREIPDEHFNTHDWPLK